MTEWRKSSASGANNCVEVAIEPPVVLLRNSRDPHTRLSLSTDEWDAFLAGVVSGEFDLDPEMP